MTNEKKILPHGMDAEKSVIGCILLDKDAILKVADLLEGIDFYHDHHRFIYEAAMDLFQTSEPVDLVTVATRLQAGSKLELIGGPEYLAELQNMVPVATHIYQYAQIVKHLSVLRKVIKAGQNITALGYDEQKKVEEVLEAAEKQVFSVSQTFLKDRFIPIKDILNKSFEKISEVHENPELANKGKVKTHFRDLDDKLNGGLNPSDLVIIAARPSMGKTALCLALAQNAALKSGKKIGIMSLEMSREQLVERMFCSMLQVDSWKLHRGKLNEQDFERMGPIMDQLGNAHIFIDDSMGSSIVELRAKARRLKMEHGLDILVIDYLQLMSGGNPMNRVQEISEISRSLKQLARELHMPIIALSQLSRNVESRPEKRPVLSDLRDSGSIEQDADIVMMLYREEYYNEDCSEEEKGVLEVNILKHRNGGVGRVKLKVDLKKMKFEDFKEKYQAGF
ncbi:MAG TPA: replicative DNA helicase [Candidatus Gracilibacteria bacterium]